MRRKKTRVRTHRRKGTKGVKAHSRMIKKKPTHLYKWRWASSIDKACEGGAPYIRQDWYGLNKKYPKLNARFVMAHSCYVGQVLIEIYAMTKKDMRKALGIASKEVEHLVGRNVSENMKYAYNFHER